MRSSKGFGGQHEGYRWNKAYRYKQYKADKQFVIKILIYKVLKCNGGT